MDFNLSTFEADYCRGMHALFWGIALFALFALLLQCLPQITAWPVVRRFGPDKKHSSVMHVTGGSTVSARPESALPSTDR